MQHKYDPKLTPLAQRLRKDMTKEERRLWYDFLKGLPAGFRRQAVLGSYIVDFYCPSAKLVVELDGSQHFEAEGQAADRVRDEYLAGRGLRVLRYSNADVNSNFQGVCEDILKQL
jgi:very-short-patch-repair endonuclease